MAETQASKRKLGEVLGILEKSYGKVHALPEEPPLDHAVYLLLRENWDYRKAVRALRVLQKEFVDWNEIRVSTGGELRSILAPLGDRDIDVKIEKVRTLLDNLYREYNCVHLNFLVDMEPDRQRRFLGHMGVLNPAQIQILMQCLKGMDEWEVPAQAIRVLTRVGLMPRVYSAASARKNAEAMLGDHDVLTFQAHLVHHGEDICLVKSPRCGECAIVKLCGFKRKVGVG